MILVWHIQSCLAAAGGVRELLLLTRDVLSILPWSWNVSGAGLGCWALLPGFCCPARVQIRLWLGMGKVPGSHIQACAYVSLR